MAVITLPQDTRWGDLGKGLGSLIGGVVQSIQDKQVSEDVSMLYQDPAYKNNPVGLLSEVSKKWGAAGIKSLTQLLDSQAKIGQIGLLDTQRRLGTVKADVAEATEPTQILQAKAELEALKAKTALTGAETAYTAGPRTAATTAQAALTGAETPGAAATSTMKQQEATRGLGTTTAKSAEEEARLKKLEADALEAQIEENKRLWAPAPGQATDGTGGTNAEARIKAAIPDVTPTEQSRIMGAAQGSKTPLASLNKEIDAVIKERQRADLSKTGLSAQDAKLIDQSAGALPAMKPFLQANSGAEGLIGGVKAYLTKKGIGQDPTVMEAAAATEQNLKQFVSTGSGLQGAPRIALGREVLPGMSHQPVYNVVASELMAKEMVGRLEVLKQRVEAVPKQADQAKVVQGQIDQWKQIQDQAASLWWGYDDNTPGKSKGMLHYYYQGQEINPQTLAPIAPIPVDQTKRYRISNGATLSGTDLLDTIRQAGLNPLAGMRKLGATELPQGQ